jgi:DNA-binding MarR family transcriptional regulator
VGRSSDHDANVVGAAILLVADRMREAVTIATGTGGAQPAALTALHGWANGRSIETLSQGLGLSHSRTVRVVSRLVEQGLATRTADNADRRQAVIELTSEGTRVAETVLAVRAAVLAEVMSSLPERRRTELARIAELVVLALVESRESARLACRLCDVQACGHEDGRCPSTQAAERSEDLKPQGRLWPGPTSSSPQGRDHRRTP